MFASRIRLAAALTLVALTCSCTFNRTVMNEKVRHLDPSFIELGKTTWREVVRELGPPDPNIRVLRQLMYTSTDRRTSSLRLGSIVILPFRWYEEARVERLMIELDEKGVVVGVYRSERDATRPPFDSPDAREAGFTTVRMLEEAP